MLNVAIAFWNIRCQREREREGGGLLNVPAIG